MNEYSDPCNTICYVVDTLETEDKWVLNGHFRLYIRFRRI